MSENKLVMLKSADFGKVTAISGLLGNTLDLVQHLLHPFAPTIAAPIQMIMGIFCFVWFPMLARDLFRLAQESSYTRTHDNGNVRPAHS